MILEFIPNHTSDQSDWFKKSAARDPCCEDFYVWRDASEINVTTGEPIPPNDWVRRHCQKIQSAQQPTAPRNIQRAHWFTPF